MVMNRRHTEDPFAGQLERGHLDHYRQGFHHEHAAHDEQHNFLPDDDRDRPKGGTKGQRSDIAHEDLRGIGVEPEKAEPCADQRAAEHDQLASAGDIGNQQIVGKIYVA